MLVSAGALPLAVACRTPYIAILNSHNCRSQTFKYYGKCVLPVGTYWSFGMNSFQNMRVAVQTDPLPERIFTMRVKFLERLHHSW